MSDDGRPDARLTAALDAWAAAPTAATRAEVLAALSDARVFLALSARALATEVQVSGLRAESHAELALLSLVRPDGARALVAFADGHAVQRWRDGARPVPVPSAQACATALEDGGAALLLDPHAAGFPVPADELRALAAGWVPVPGSGLASRRTSPALEPYEDAALSAALRRALQGEPLAAARLLRGDDGPVLGVVPRAPLGAAALAALAGRVRDRLGTDLPPAGLDLAVVPADGPGADLLGRPDGSRRGWLRRGR